MTKKEIVRKVWFILSLIYTLYLAIMILLGKGSITTIVCAIICCFFFAIYVIICIAYEISRIIYNYKVYKLLLYRFEYLQTIHDARYKLYFSGNKEKVDEYSAEIEKHANSILNIGKLAIPNNLLSKKYIQNIEKILKKTEELKIRIN